METSYVLYADDDTDDREMMEEMFGSYPGHTLLTFKDGQHLLTYVNKNQKANVCLIVLDMNMPLIDGVSTLEHIRKESQFKDVPVVMYTTSSSPVDRSKVEGLNARIITKPISYAQVQQVTKEMLEYCYTYKKKDSLSA